MMVQRNAPERAGIGMSGSTKFNCNDSTASLRVVSGELGQRQRLSNFGYVLDNFPVG